MERADAEVEHMGLTTWEKAPHNKIVKTDVVVAKNYLKENELKELGRIVSAYLDLAENRAKRHIPMTMEDWARHLDRILQADDRELLQDAGRISAEIAKEHAYSVIACVFGRYLIGCNGAASFHIANHSQCVFRDFELAKSCTKHIIVPCSTNIFSPF